MDEQEIVNLSDIDPNADKNDERDIEYHPLAKKFKQENLIHYERQKQNKVPKKIVNKTKVQPKRDRPKPNRFGSRASTYNHDEFFSSLEKNRKKNSDFSESSTKESLIVVETSPNNCSEINSNSMKVQTKFSESETHIAKSTCKSGSFESGQSYHETNHDNRENQQNHENQANHVTSQLASVVSDFLRKFENKVLENFQQLDSGMELVRVQVARVEAKLTESHLMSLNQNTKTSSNCTDTPESIGLPIRTKSDLECFEDRLKDADFQKKVVNKHITATKTAVFHFILFTGIGIV